MRWKCQAASGDTWQAVTRQRQRAGGNSTEHWNSSQLQLSTGTAANFEKGTKGDATTQHGFYDGNVATQPPVALRYKGLHVLKHYQRSAKGFSAVAKLGHIVYCTKLSRAPPDTQPNPSSHTPAHIHACPNRYVHDSVHVCVQVLTRLHTYERYHVSGSFLGGLRKRQNPAVFW